MWTSLSKESELIAVDATQGYPDPSLRIIDSFEGVTDHSASPSPVPPVASAGKHPGAIEVHSRYPSIPSIVVFHNEDEGGYPIYVSDDGGTYFCHEPWPGWSARSGSCSGDYVWTSQSQAPELADVDAALGYDDASARLIDSFKVAADYSGNHDSKYGADLFTDPSFPPGQGILGNIVAERPELLGGGQIEWIRALDINRGGEETLFDEMDFTDPKQGAIGDCWLIASMGVAALNHGHFIKDLFQEKMVSSTGKYSVKFWDIRKGDQGDWEWVTVDDWLPCQPRGKYRQSALPLFSAFENNEIWPMILEKAFAKFVGGYDHLIAGNGVWGWQALGICQDMSIISNDRETSGGWMARHNDITTQRQKMMLPEDPEKGEGRRTMAGLIVDEPLSSEGLWGRLVGMRNIMAEGDCCKDNTNNEDAGIPGGHAYSILSAMEAQTNNGEQVRLIRLRNPWGNDVQFKGDWGRESPKWIEHPEVQVQITSTLGGDDRHAEDDGVFWMTFADFEYYYFAVEVCNFIPHTHGHDEL